MLGEQLLRRSVMTSCHYALSPLKGVMRATQSCHGTLRVKRSSVVYLEFHKAKKLSQPLTLLALIYLN